MNAPLPTDETERLAALHDHSILDTEPSQVFDDVVRLAASICGTPIAAVSLVDEHRQWFKAIMGLAVTETPRDMAFCAHTILQPDMLVVEDAQADPRFADNPLVTNDPSIRFYAGVQLLTEEGCALGSLCVIDRVPRTLTVDQEETLRLLARQVTGHLTAARRVAEMERLVSEREYLVARREQAEAERLKLAAIVETSADAIYSMSLDRMATSWNAGAERLYGYTASEAIGHQINFLIPPDCLGETKQLLDAVARGEAVTALETVRLTKSGILVEVSLHASPVISLNGQIVGVSIIARDITVRKRAEAALEAEREFTRALLESLDEGIIACDAQGTLTLFNRATSEFHGLPEHPFLPEQWTDHFDLYQADGITPMQTEDIPLFRAFRGEVVRNAEMVISSKVGPARTVLASGQTIKGKDGQTLGAVAAMHDVTQERQAQRELARMAAIVESSEEAIVAGTLDGTIVGWNRGAERLYGYAASEMIGQHSSVLANDDEKRMGPGIVARLLRGEAIEPMEVIRTRKDGSEADVSLSFSLIRSSGGETVGISCISRDITSRKITEAALAESNARLQDSETRLRQLSDAAFEGIAVSQDGVLVDTNAAFAEQFGYSCPAEMVGVTASLLTAPESRALMLEKVAECNEEPYEAVLQRKNGTTFQAEVRGRSTQRGGRPARVTAVRDVSRQKALEGELREREATLRAILESAPIILYAADQSGTVTLSEGTGLAALGLQPGEVVGRSLFEFSEGDPDSLENTLRALAGEDVSFDANYGDICLHTEIRPLYKGNDTPAGLIGVCFDVTERVRSEERFRVLFEASSDAHLLLGEGGTIDCNAAAVTLFGCSDKAQMLSLHPATMSPEFQPDGRTSKEKKGEMDALAYEQGCHRFDWVLRRRSGEEFPVEVTLTPVTVAERPVLLAVLHDLTERKRAEDQIRDYAVILEFQKNQLEQANAEMENANAQLESLATTDGLTGLKNHRSFQERLGEEVGRAARYGTPLSLILLDVDRFKQLNDAHGHPAGDAVLRAVARELQDCARDTDLVARYGGEEFVLILPQTDLDGATAFAERLRETIQYRPWPVQAVTASFGVATLCLGDEDSAELIARADVAMYASKTGGRNRVTRAKGKVIAPTLPFLEPIS